MTLAPVRLSEAADSLAKASTPEPFSSSKTSNWVARAGGLPDYVQHIAHDLMEKRGKSESNAIQMAIGIVKRWCRGGGNVDANTKAAACKAVSEWEAKKAGAHAKSAVQHSAVEKWRMPSLADERAIVEAAIERLLVLERQFGTGGLVPLLAEGTLAESASWSPTMKRCASASDEMERHEVYDGGQHVGTLSRRKAYDPKAGDRFAAFAVNGQRVTDYNNTSKVDALKALQSHLEEAPARVIALPTAGKYLVARPSSYSGETTYSQFSSEPAARHAAGLPPQPTVPERNSKVEAIAEMLRWDLMTVSGLDLPPLRRVQEARRRDPFDLVAEAFDAGELRDFRGKWRAGGHLTPRMVAPTRTRARALGAAVGHRKTPVQHRYEGGVVRASAKARAAHAAKPQLSHEELAKVGRAAQSAGTRKIVGDLKAGRVLDTQTAHRTGANGTYSPARKALHEKIITALLQGKGTHEGKAQAVFTAGGPASGKSSIVNAGHVKVPEDAVHIDPDLIKSMLPEYQQLLREGHKGAASFAHEESSDIAKALARIALGRQHHVLVDSVGDSGPGKFAGKIRDAKNAGHTVRVHYATVDTGEAIRRADERARKTGRAVPHDFIREAHQAVSQRFAEVSAIPGIHVVVHDTAAKGAPIIASKNRGDDTMVIRNGERFRAFQAKANEG